MSHSQFHCTGRVYLDMHGLSFETSICYWQDQPGSRHPRRARAASRTAPARRTRPLPSGDCRRAGSDPRRSGLHGRDGGVSAAAGTARNQAARLGGGRRRRSRTLPPHAARVAHRPAPGGRPFPRPPRARSRDRCAAFFFFFSPRAAFSRTHGTPPLPVEAAGGGEARVARARSARHRRTPPPTGADPPPEAGHSPPTQAPPAPKKTAAGGRGGRAGGGGGR